MHLMKTIKIKKKLYNETNYCKKEKQEMEAPLGLILLMSLTWLASL